MPQGLARRRRAAASSFMLRPVSKPRRSDAPRLDLPRLNAAVDGVWNESAVQALIEYIRIPNKSPAFDAEWRQHGHMERAVELIESWCRRHAPPGASLEVLRLDGRTPLIYMEIPATDPAAGDDTILLYGHLDKQPEMVGWEPGLGPWEPVLRGDRLYGRGSADDGYAAFAATTALRALAEQKIPHARCVLLIEACEESGSGDLPAYIDH